MPKAYILMAILGSISAICCALYTEKKYSLTPNYLYAAIGGGIGAILLTFLNHNMFIVCIDILLCSIYITGAIIDKQIYILPDMGCILTVILFIGYILLGLYNGFFLSAPIEGVVQSITMAAIYLVLQKISHGGVGDGDIKWSAVMALWIPLDYMPTFLFLPFILGTVYVSIQKIRHKSIGKRIPFGPFLAIGTILTMLFAYGDIL